MNQSGKSDSETIQPRIEKIKLILFDVDGVMTDGSIILNNQNDEIKIFNVQDGMGVTLARMGGLKTGILTGRRSRVVEHRAKELKVDIVYQGAFQKLPPYLDILKNYNLVDEQVCYMGDDVLDLPVLERVGLSCAPANAREEVKQKVSVVTQAAGGSGALREIIDMILVSQGKWQNILKKCRTIE